MGLDIILSYIWGWDMLKWEAGIGPIGPELKVSGR